MNKPIILCIDDEKIILDSLGSELSKSVGSNYIIELAESGEEALELIEEIIQDDGEIAVIISDYIMPGMKGDEVLIKAHELLPDTLKIMLTGQADATAVGNVINKAKLYHYISKPWAKEELVLTVTNALNQYEHYRELMLAVEEKKNANKKIIDTRKKLFEAHNQKLKEHQTSIDDLTKELENIISEKNTIVEKYAQLFEENKQLKIKAVSYKKKIDELAENSSFGAVVKKEVLRSSELAHPLSCVTFGIDNFDMVSKKLDNKKDELHLLILVKQYIEEIIKSYHYFAKSDMNGKFYLLLVEASTPKAREIINELNQQLSVKIGRYRETLITFSYGISTFVHTSVEGKINIEEVAKSLQDKSETAYIQAKADGRNSISELR